MRFINRKHEMERLMRAVQGDAAALVVVWGRRRLGKSRLLAEWCKQTDGTYWVADESAPAIQRQYLATELDTILPGFANVSYPDWSALLNRLSNDARRINWRGPLVVDEFPYLVPGAPELPSVLQKWIDHEKREGGITIALSGSSQRMMLDSVLNSNAPLYGRADQIFKLEPLLPGFIRQAAGISDPQSLLDFYTCWGGVPRYWELAQPFHNRQRDALDELVLSPLGALHDEVDRLLRQEMPSAVSLRPILDAIGLGAHRSSEIAARLQTPATSLTRGLKQLQKLGYICRETPYGENEKRGKKALYHLADPFLRLWFRVIASHRSRLQTASKAGRLRVCDRHWSHLRAQAWEELCRLAIPRLGLFHQDWHPAGRHWAGNQSEWDVVSTSFEEEIILLGECKSLSRPAGKTDIEKIVRGLSSKLTPENIRRGNSQREHVIFVPVLNKKIDALPPDITVVDGRRVFSALAEEEGSG